MNIDWFRFGRVVFAMTLDDAKTAARQVAFARRKDAHARDPGTGAGHLSQVLAGYRGACVSGFMPINTEIKTN